MSRKIRQTKDNNIVIVCEGSETEAPYFEDLKREIETRYPDRFTKIRIVPVNEEKVKQSKKRPSSKRILPPEYSYWVQIEENKDLYKEYKAQPLRYVREAQLFMERDGYVEAWAVFDHDNFHKRKDAFEHTYKVENLHIAFSSISFEGWILAHFERNPKAFLRSQCKDDDGHPIDCENNKLQGCCGQECLASYLRLKDYIEKYDKDGSRLFVSLKERLETAMINAAWLRHLESSPIYERNPYTDVDRLVSRLTGLEKEYAWIRLGEEFKFKGVTISVEKENDEVRIKSKNTCIISKENLINTDLEGNDSAPMLDRLIFSGVSAPISVNAPYLRFESEAKSFFIDLTC